MAILGFWGLDLTTKESMASTAAGIQTEIYDYFNLKGTRCGKSKNVFAWDQIFDCLNQNWQNISSQFVLKSVVRISAVLWHHRWELSNLHVPTNQKSVVWCCSADFKRCTPGRRKWAGLWSLWLRPPKRLFWTELLKKQLFWLHFCDILTKMCHIHWDKMGRLYLKYLMVRIGGQESTGEGF